MAAGKNAISASPPTPMPGDSHPSTDQGGARTTASALSEKIPPETVTANIDPSDDDVVGPPSAIEDCEARLERAHVKYRPAKVPLVTHGKMLCGAHQAVTYEKGPEEIAFIPHPTVSCPLALGFARFESLVQRLAQKHLGQRVKSIHVGGAYNCRSMARFKLVSEHSYANAIDIYGLTLENGKRVNVLHDFGRPEKEPLEKSGVFLRELAQAAFDEQIFSVVVTRFFDELHRDHIHVDMAHYRTDGSR
jgi:hypothetical protein